MNSTYWTNQKYCNFYIFTQQVSQNFHKTFIFSCGWPQFHILLFYFDLYKIDISIIVKILWNLLCQYNNIYAGSYKYLKEKKSTNEKRKKKKKKRYSYSATWTNQNDTGVIVQNLGNKMAHYTKRGIVEALPLFI